MITLATVGLTRVITVGAKLTVRTCGTSAAELITALPACEAVRVVVPTEKIVTVFPVTVAMAGFELV